MIRIGILSDTHLHRCSPAFTAQVAACFAEVSIIFHAGDLTSTTILAAFADKTVHAVHGNMCGLSCRQLLPRKITVRVGDFTFGIIHRSGKDYDFEDDLMNEFDGVDCIVYGHTHQPVCKKVGNLLLINPGSFMATGRYGAPGTYAIVEVGSQLSGSLYTAPYLEL